MSVKASAPGLSASSLLLMALACGLCAGGNYFNQPLLHSIAGYFAVSEAAAAASVTLAQVAYAAGLLLLTPLGDKLQRRGLAVSLMLLAALGQALCGLAGQFNLFILGTLMAGLFSVAAQVLVPMAAALAQPGQSGRAVGWVMSGLLLGILPTSLYIDFCCCLMTIVPTVFLYLFLLSFPTNNIFSLQVI